MSTDRDGHLTETSYGGVVLRGDDVLVIRPAGKRVTGLPKGGPERGETPEQTAAREVREETGVVVDPASCQLHWISSSEPRPNRILIFAVTEAVDVLPAFVPNPETQERGVIQGPGGLDEDFAFSTHAEAAKRYFATRGITGHHAFAPR